MAKTVTISTRITPELKGRLEAVLDGQSLREWLEGVVEAYEKAGDTEIQVQELQEEEKNLQDSIRDLEAQKAELEETVNLLKSSLVPAINECKEKALGAIEATGRELQEKIEAYGEACRLSETMRRDLFLAACLYYMAIPELARQVDPATVVFILDRIKRWAESTGINPKAKPPEAVIGGEWLYREWELGLTDLILWAVSGLVPLCGDNTGQAAHSRITGVSTSNSRKNVGNPAGF